MPLSKLIKNPVLLFWIKRYLNLILFSTLFRVFECIYFYKLFVVNGFYEFLKSLAIGFIFDTCVVSIILLLIFIITATFKLSKIGYNQLMIVSYFLVMMFNAFNFLHLVSFGVCFNYYTLMQLNSTVIKAILAKPQFYIAFLSLFFGFIVIKSFIKKREIPPFSNWKKESIIVLLFLFLSSFIFLPFPFYYYCNISSNTIINEIPKNGIFSYVSSVKTILTASDLIEDTDEISLDKAVKIVSQNFSNVNEIKNGKIIRTVEPDTNFNRYKHIIVIVMESLGSNMFNDSIAPQLYKLKEDGIYYSKCKATGPRTQMAVSTILTGVPNIVGKNYYRRKGIYKIETLADYLTPLKYNCYYIHNGYLKYDDVDKLLLQGGFQNLIDANNITNYKQINSWGVDDEALYIKAKEHIDETKHLKTFHILQTITNHEPFDIPKDFIASNKHISKWDKKLQTYYYADFMAGRFIKQLQTRPDFDSTLVFITGDHGEAYQESDLSYKVFHVPLIVLNGKIKPKLIDYDCSHMDIPYTIISACGYNKKTIMFGENLFSLKPNRMIMSTNYNTELNIKSGDTLYRYSFEKQSETLVRINSEEFEDAEIKKKNAKQVERIKTNAFANYKLVRDYLLSGKINR